MRDATANHCCCSCDDCTRTPAGNAVAPVHSESKDGICRTFQRRVVERCLCALQGGDLTDAIRGSRNGEFGWFGKGRNIAIDVGKGLAFLHSNRIVHCDLKSKNIMLTAVRHCAPLL